MSSLRSGRTVSFAPGTSFSTNKLLCDQQLAKFIKDHLRTNRGRIGMVYGADQIQSLLDKVIVILKAQEMLIRTRAPIKIVGDLHGQFTDLKRIFRANGRPPDVKYCFLGDYVDRGKHSLECIMLLFSYKALYPDSIALLRGNHECLSVNRIYGFYDELTRRDLGKLYPEFNRVFDWLPMAATVSGKLLCMHGGISKYIKDLKQITNLKRPITMLDDNSPEIACDLLWSDPSRDLTGFTPSERGISYFFGMDALEKFCLTNKVECVIRGHQVVERGFERMGPTHRTRIVTVFSAPNYCNEFDNSAAVLIVNEKLGIQFSVLEPSGDLQYRAQREIDRANTPKTDVFPKNNRA